MVLFKYLRLYIINNFYYIIWQTLRLSDKRCFVQRFMLSRVLKRQVRYQQSNPQEIQFSTLLVNCSNVTKIDPLLSAKALMPFTYISHLYLNHNRIHTLTGIQQFKNLETFHFNYNWVSEIKDLLLIQNKFFLKSIGYIGNPIEGKQDILVNQVKSYNFGPINENLHIAGNIRRISKDKFGNIDRQEQFQIASIKTIFPNLKQWNSIHSVIQQSEMYMYLCSQQQQQSKTFIAYPGKQKKNPKNSTQTLRYFKSRQRNTSFKTLKPEPVNKNQQIMRQNHEGLLYDRQMRAKTQNQTPFKIIEHLKDNQSHRFVHSDSEYLDKESSNFQSGKKLQSTKRNSNNTGRMKARNFIDEIRIRPFDANPSHQCYDNNKTFMRSNKHSDVRNQVVKTARFSANKSQHSQDQIYSLNEIQQQRQMLVNAFYRRSLLQKTFNAIKSIKTCNKLFTQRSDQKLKKHAWIKIRINNAIKNQLQHHQGWLLYQ